LTNVLTGNILTTVLILENIYVVVSKNINVIFFMMIL